MCGISPFYINLGLGCGTDSIIRALLAETPSGPRKAELNTKSQRPKEQRHLIAAKSGLSSLLKRDSCKFPRFLSLRLELDL